MLSPSSDGFPALQSSLAGVGTCEFEDFDPFEKKLKINTIISFPKAA